MQTQLPGLCAQQQVLAVTQNWTEKKSHFGKPKPAWKELRTAAGGSGPRVPSSNLKSGTCSACLSLPCSVSGPFSLSDPEAIEASEAQGDARQAEPSLGEAALAAAHACRRRREETKSHKSDH